MRRWAQLVATILPTLILFSLIGLTAEIYLRVARHGAQAVMQPLRYMAPRFRPVDCLRTGPSGELMTPNCTMFLNGVELRTNSAGRNDREANEEAIGFRVLVLGDSVTLPMGVPRGGAYHELLEERLERELGAPGFVELYNLARDGRSTDLQVGDLEAETAELSLDAVLVGLTPSDFWDNLLEPVGNCGPGDDDSRVTQQERRFYKRRVKGKSFLSSALAKAERATGLWLFHAPQGLIRGVWRRWGSSPADGERLAVLERKAIRAFRQCAQRMRAIAHAAEIDLVWVVVSYEPSSHAQLMAAELESLHEQVVSMMDVHEQFADPADLTIYTGDSHPSFRVHRVFADRLYDYLDTIGWVSRLQLAHGAAEK